MSDLLKLSKPIQPRFISKVKAGGGFEADYVKHSVIVEHLLGIIGPFDQEVKEILRGPGGEVEGVVGRFTFQIDGDTVVIEEAGGVERKDKGKALPAGEALKDCMSDAVKRAASRIGLGTHLWSGPGYTLYDSLSKRVPDHPSKEGFVPKLITEKEATDE